MDLYVKKEDLETDIIFDLVVGDNDVSKDGSYLTASLLSIFTDGSKPQIGTQIDGSIIGNMNYNISKLSEENIKNYKNGLIKSLKWLITDRIVLSYIVEVEKKANRLNIKITFKKIDDDTDSLIYSLDENFELLK